VRLFKAVFLSGIKRCVFMCGFLEPVPFLSTLCKHTWCGLCSGLGAAGDAYRTRVNRRGWAAGYDSGASSSQNEVSSYLWGTIV